MDKIYNRFNPMKALIYADRIEQIVDGQIPNPVVWHIYPTNRCQLNCWYCIMKGEQEKHKDAILSDEAMWKIPADAVEHDIKMVQFVGGGEPLMHPETIMVAIALRVNMIRTALSTNGVLMHEPHLILQAFDYIRISLDAGNAKSYQKRKGVDLFDTVMCNVKNLVAIKKAKQWKNDIALGFVITPENYEEIYEFCWLAMKAKVDFVHIRPAYLENDALLMRLMPEIIKLSEQAKRDFGDHLDIYTIKDKFDGYWTPRTYDKCRSTPLIAVMTATGEFIPCLDVFSPRWGNYNKQRFAEAWFSQEHKEAIASLDLDNCPRCVNTKINEIIQNCFIYDDIRKVIL